MLVGKSVTTKIIVNGSAQGWTSFDEIVLESDEAEAADTNAGDPYFYSSLRGTTGMPKIVTHTHLSYPLGHLTASWIGLRKGDVHYNISQPGWAKFAEQFFCHGGWGNSIRVLSERGVLMLRNNWL